MFLVEHGVRLHYCDTTGQADSDRSSHGRKGPSFPWTTYCDQCLAMVAAQVNISDQLLVHLVKLRLLATRSEDHSGVGFTLADSASFPTAYLKSLSRQLAALKAEMPTDLADSSELSPPRPRVVIYRRSDFLLGVEMQYFDVRDKSSTPGTS